MVSWDLIIFIVEALLKSESQSIVNSNVTDVLLQISTTTTTNATNANNHWVGGMGACLLQMIIQRDRPLANDRNSNKRFALFTWSGLAPLLSYSKISAPFLNPDWMITTYVV